MGGIAIRTNTQDLDLKETLSNLFQADFIQSEKFLDARHTDCFYVSKNKDYLIIYNSDIVREIFENNPSVEFQRIYQYFNHSDLIFAFEEYDSGDTYSYAIFENGELIRKYRYSNEEVLIDEGDLLPIELKWKNARTETEYDEDYDDEDEEIEISYLVYFDPDDESISYTEFQLPHMILRELMNEKLGFDTDGEWDIKTGDGYFKKVS